MPGGQSDSDPRSITNSLAKPSSDRLQSKAVYVLVFESTTETINGETCMTAEDVLLLANGCDLGKLREVVSEAIANKVFVFVDSASSILGSWTLPMRYVWPEHKWHNNIHTDIYARQLGYERGLVEGPGVADVVYALCLGTSRTLPKFRVSWEYLAPLYERTMVVLVSHNRSESRVRRFSVCELPREIPGKCRALLNVELETL